MTPVSLSPWQTPPAKPCLANNTVHLWRFALTESLSSLKLLNTAEAHRFAQLRAPEQAQAFAVARTRLRQILGRYLEVSPQEVCFTYNDNDKPSLAEKHGAEIFFNLSHSGGWGLCALTSVGAIGVDVERIKPALAFEPVAERFFSAEESAWLLSRTETRRRRNFFRLWTRKEAWLKGKGGGFSEQNLELNLDHISGRTSHADSWWLTNFAVMRGYVGALAVAGKIERLERWKWQG